VNDQDPVVWRSSDDMVEIANSTNNWSYVNLSPALQAWVRGQGIALGWAAVYFPLAHPRKTLRAAREPFS
jgi:hypothetical protein